MARLSEMHRLIGNYLELHGDKDVTSIGTSGGSNSDTEYVLHLHDIHDGPVGTNPYTGADEINIPCRDFHTNGKIAGEMIKMMFRSMER